MCGGSIYAFLTVFFLAEIRAYGELRKYRVIILLSENGATVVAISP